MGESHGSKKSICQNDKKNERLPLEGQWDHSSSTEVRLRGAKAETAGGALLSSGLAADYWKASTGETSVGRKGKVALFRRLATWGEGGLMSKSQFPTPDQWASAFKGEFQGVYR